MCFITENFLLSRAVVRSRYGWILEFTHSRPRKSVKYDAQQNRPLNTAFHDEDSSFKATFTNMEITECKWLAHDGQAPDAE